MPSSSTSDRRNNTSRQMESQLQQTHHTHARHYDELSGTGTGGDYNEDEHHGDKKSVIKKVKAKAKKLKDTITKHGHGHHHHDDDDDDDDDDYNEEMVQDPEVHGAPMYDSTMVRVGLSGPDVNLPQPRGSLGRPPVGEHDTPPPVSTGPYGAAGSEPSGRHQAYGQDVNPQQWRGKIGQSAGLEEDPFSSNPTRVTQVGHHGSGQDVNEEQLRGKIGKSTGMVEDPHAPKDPSRVASDPSNYETKVTDPTHTGGREAGMSQIQHSLNKMGIHDEHDSGFVPETKSFDPNSPENLPRDTLSGNPSSQSSSYTEKISAATSAIADKAAVAKDVIASKLGYSGQNPTESHETGKKSGTATDYAHKITDTATGTLAPLYEKVVDAGSSVMSKMQGTVSGTGERLPEVQRPLKMVTEGADKGVSVKEYLVETLRPGDEDKALSEVITHAFRRGKDGECGKKSGEDRRPVGRVTESEEVRRRLGSDRREEKRQHHSREVRAEKSVTERLSTAVGSLFMGKGNTPEGSLGTTYVTDEGLSSSPSGDGNGRGAKGQ